MIRDDIAPTKPVYTVRGVAGTVDDIVRIPADEFHDLMDKVERGESGSGARSENWMVGGFDMMGRKWLLRRSKDAKLPDWQRLAFFAYAKVRKDGHVPAGDNELALMLDKPKMRNDKLKDKIDEAISREFLAAGSNRRCLIVPYDVRYLTTVDVRSGCDRH